MLADKLKADVEMLRAALKPFTFERKSGEHFASTMSYVSPAQELRNQAAAMERRDAEIQAAREAFAKT